MIVLQIQFPNELFFSRAGAFCHMFTFYQLMPSWQFPWAMLWRWVINARWGGRKSIFHNLFVSLTVVSINGRVSLQESVAITSRLAINELYENVIIIIFSRAYQTSPGSSLLPFLNAAWVKCIIYKCGFSSVFPPRPAKCENLWVIVCGVGVLFFVFFLVVFFLNMPLLN